MSYSGDEEVIAADKSNYPRTGRRGVPQQFPRKLYEMLEAESRDREIIVHWSISGRAFRIADVSLFSTMILPKYFKTSKFSSFQRNLNLYGFTKIRKGPEIDMYFHPGFIRGDIDGISQLRKRTKPSIKKNQSIRTLSMTPQITHSAGFSYDLQQSTMRVISPTMQQTTTMKVISPTPTITTCVSMESYGDPHSPFKALPPPLYRQSCHDRRSPERLTLLADAMLMMIEGE